MLSTTMLAGALLLQSPAGAETSVPATPISSSASLATGEPQWFATDPGKSGWGFRNYLPRVGVAHRSQGYGYDRGYTSLDGFVPLFQNDFDKLTAFQGSYLVDNGGEYGFNAGLIQREYLPGWDKVIGVNGFYDHRREDGSSFNQVGIGAEILGARTDWRMNGYIPVGDDTFVADNAQVTYAAFQGRQVLVNFLANKALTGFDSEFGGVLPGTLDMVRGYAGLYHFQGDESDDLTGVQARLEARLQDSLVLHLGITNDNTFDTNVVLGIGWYFPGFAPRNTPPNGAVGARLADSVYRNQNIIIERSEMKEPVPARWEDGTIIEVVHVDSTAVAGIGTVNFPFQSLNAADAFAGPDSILFVHANSVFAGEEVVLQNGQQLLGEGIDHTIQSMYGSFLLPTVTPPEDVVAVPLIGSAPGVAVTMAGDDTVVAGFRIYNAGGDAVFGTGLTDVTVRGLDIQSPAGSGIVLTDVAGHITVKDTFVTNGTNVGIEVSTAATGDNTLTITDNTVMGNPNVGISVTTNGDTDNTLFFERNRVFVSLGPSSFRYEDDLTTVTQISDIGVDPTIEFAPLVRIETLGNSRLLARVDENLIDDSFSDPGNVLDDDPSFDHVLFSVAENSHADAGFANNRFESNRSFSSPATGPFGLDVVSRDLAELRLRLDTNTADLNFALREEFISVFQVEDTLDTNTGTFYYFPFDAFIDVIPSGTIELP